MTFITSISSRPLHVPLQPSPSATDDKPTAQPADKAGGRDTAAGNLLQRWPLARLYAQRGALQQTTLQLQALALQEKMLAGPEVSPQILSGTQQSSADLAFPPLEKGGEGGFTLGQEMARLRQQDSVLRAGLGLGDADDPAAALADDAQQLQQQAAWQRHRQLTELRHSLQPLRQPQAAPAAEALATARTALTQELQHYLDSLPGPRTASESQLAQLLDSSSLASTPLSKSLSAASPQDTAPPADALADSHYEFYDQLIALLERLEGEWLERYQDILDKYIKFFDKLTSIMAKIKDAIGPPNSDGNMVVDFREIADDLQKLMNDFSALGLGGSFKTKAEADQFLKDLGLNGIVVRRAANGDYELAIDSNLIRDLRETLRMDKGDGGSDGPFRSTISPTAFNAIIAAKDSLMERFNHINRVMAEKYQRQLQLWDTLVKAITATIDSIAEADRLYIQNFT